MIIQIENTRFVKEHIISYTPISDEKLIVVYTDGKYHFEFPDKSYRDYILYKLDEEFGGVKSFVPPKNKNAWAV